MLTSSAPRLWHLVLFVAAAFPALAEEHSSAATLAAEPRGEEEKKTNATNASMPWLNEPHEDVPVEDAVDILGWAGDDPVQVYYGEFLMSSWLTERAAWLEEGQKDKWNCYHSGLGFLNTRTRERSLFDFTPVDPSSVYNMVLPLPNMTSLWRALVLGEVNFWYRDDARVHAHKGWNHQYTKFVRLGRINGSIFNAYARLMAEEFAPRFKAFRPMEVATQAQTLSAAHGVALRSFMCHDFVMESLWALYKLGARYTFTPPIHRDHVFLYVDGYEPVEPNDRRMARRQLRFLRSLVPYAEAVKGSFISTRSTLTKLWKLGIPVFFRNHEGDFRLHMVPPFVNYCYIPMKLPPNHYDPFMAEKLCALGFEANMTNKSAIWPSGHLLAAEERMDQPEIFMSFCLILLSSLVMGAFPSAVQARTKLE